MTVNKRKKNSWQRGTHTHGWGSKKKHRGAGSRGGHGGTGKRGDSLKPCIWKNKDYFGKHGFFSIRREKINAININDIQDKIETFVKRGFAAEKSGEYHVDLAVLGCNKLLGTGKVKNKFHIKTKYATEKAVQKIQSAGGNVEIQKNEKEPSPRTKEGEKGKSGFSAKSKNPENNAGEAKPSAGAKKSEPAKAEKGGNNLDIKSPTELIKEVKQ